MTNTDWLSSSLPFLLIGKGHTSPQKREKVPFPCPWQWCYVVLNSIRVWPSPTPNYCKKLTLSWLKLGHTYPCEKDLPTHLPFAVDTLFMEAKNRIRIILDVSIIHLCYKTNWDTLQPSQVQWCTYCHGCKQCIHTSLLYHTSHLHQKIDLSYLSFGRTLDNETQAHL